MPYVDRSLTIAENAQRTILDAAQSCIDRMTPGSPNRLRAEALLATAVPPPITALPAAHRARLARYGATMHREPPSPRTILHLLRMVQPSAHDE